MRINLAQTKSMKRYLVYTTDDSRTRPFDPTRFLASATPQNHRFRPPVEKVGLATTKIDTGRVRWFMIVLPYARPGARARPPRAKGGGLGVADVKACAKSTACRRDVSSRGVG